MAHQLRHQVCMAQTIKRGPGTARSKSFDHHPYEKPAEFNNKMVLLFTDINSFVIDLTAGSGSLAVACMLGGCHYMGFENQLRMAQVGRKNLAAATDRLDGQVKQLYDNVKDENAADWKDLSHVAQQNFALVFWETMRQGPMRPPPFEMVTEDKVGGSGSKNPYLQTARDGAELGENMEAEPAPQAPSRPIVFFICEECDKKEDEVKGVKTVCAREDCGRVYCGTCALTHEKPEFCGVSCHPEEEEEEQEIENELSGKRSTG